MSPTCWGTPRGDGISPVPPPQELPSSPQPPEEDFGRGPWLAMKTELGLDERDPGCFLRTYSVVMVLRKVRGGPAPPP